MAKFIFYYYSGLAIIALFCRSRITMSKYCLPSFPLRWCKSLAQYWYRSLEVLIALDYSLIHSWPCSPDHLEPVGALQPHASFDHFTYNHLSISIIVLPHAIVQSALFRREWLGIFLVFERKKKKRNSRKTFNFARVYITCICNSCLATDKDFRVPVVQLWNLFNCAFTRCQATIITSFHELVYSRHSFIYLQKNVN